MTEVSIVEVPAQRCTATAKSTGGQCGKPAIPGGNVCRLHGGAAPQVRAAAAARMSQARDMALERMIEKLAPQESPLYEVEFKDLVTAVDKLTTKIQLLSGEATSRDETTRVEVLKQRLEVQLDQLGNRLGDRTEFLQAVTQDDDDDDDGDSIEDAEVIEEEE